MKVQILKNGKLSLILIPEEGDDIELSALKELSKNEVEVTFKEGQSPLFDGAVYDVLIIKSK